MMKRLLLVTCICLIAVSASMAQGKKLSSAPASFRTFFASFKRAIIKGDRQKIVSVTKFPFKYAFDAEDDGTMTRSEFIKGFRQNFGSDRAEYMMDRDLTWSRGDDGSYQVSSSADATHWIFVKIGNTYRFTAFYAEP